VWIAGKSNVKYPARHLPVGSIPAALGGRSESDGPRSESGARRGEVGLDLFQTCGVERQVSSPRARREARAPRAHNLTSRPAPGPWPGPTRSEVARGRPHD
jgi:hypothetical protein